MLKSTLLLLNVVAALNGVLLAMVLVFQERFGRALIRMTFAGFIFLMSALLGLFVALDSGAIAYSDVLGVTLDVMALTAGACFFLYVSAICAREAPYVIYAPIALYLILVLATGGRFLSPTNITPIIIVQLCYTLGALYVYASARAKLPKAVSDRPENQQLPALFAGILLLHAAQLLRVLFPESGFFFDFVPFVGAVGLLLIVFYGIAGSQTLTSFGRVYPTQTPTEADQLDAIVLAGKPFLDPDLSLQKLAAITKMRPRELSAYLNQKKGLTFRAYVNKLRIDEATRLLADPAEAETSVESAALLCGFRSRSSFYEAF